MVKRIATAMLGLLLAGTAMPDARRPMIPPRWCAIPPSGCSTACAATGPATRTTTPCSRLVRDVVFPRLDRERTAQWVLGANWRTATPAQREQFIAEFSDLLLRTYGTALRQYDSEKLNYLPAQAPAGADRVTVRTEIIRPDGPKVSVDYLLTNRSGEWKVYDVIIENVSLVVTYRSEYSAIIKRDGMDGLLKQLADRNRSANS